MPRLYKVSKPEGIDDLTGSASTKNCITGIISINPTKHSHKDCHRLRIAFLWLLHNFLHY